MRQMYNFPINYAIFSIIFRIFNKSHGNFWKITPNFRASLNRRILSLPSKTGAQQFVDPPHRKILHKYCVRHVDNWKGSLTHMIFINTHTFSVRKPMKRFAFWKFFVIKLKFVYVVEINSRIHKYNF